MYLCVLGVGEEVELRSELKSVTLIVKDFGIQWNFFDGFEVCGSDWNEYIDASFLLLLVGCCIRCRGLLKKELAVFRCEITQSLV